MILEGTPLFVVLPFRSFSFSACIFLFFSFFFLSFFLFSKEPFVRGARGRGTCRKQIAWAPWKTRASCRTAGRRATSVALEGTVKKRTIFLFFFFVGCCDLFFAKFPSSSLCRHRSVQGYVGPACQLGWSGLVLIVGRIWPQGQLGRPEPVCFVRLPTAALLEEENRL